MCVHHIVGIDFVYGYDLDFRKVADRKVNIDEFSGSTKRTFLFPGLDVAENLKELFLF